MKLEFIADSIELFDFVKSLKHIDDCNIVGDPDDYCRFESVYWSEAHQKHFMVECSKSDGSSSPVKFDKHRRNFDRSQPWVVTFYEVKPVEVTVTRWYNVDDETVS